MPNPTPRSEAPQETRESDQLPEEQPGGAHEGTSTPGERESQVGLDPRPDPGSRRNTGSPDDNG